MSFVFKFNQCRLHIIFLPPITLVIIKNIFQVLYGGYSKFIIIIFMVLTTVMSQLLLYIPTTTLRTSPEDRMETDRVLRVRDAGQKNKTRITGYAFGYKWRRPLVNPKAMNTEMPSRVSRIWSMSYFRFVR